MEQEAELALGEVAVNELVRDLDLLAQALDADDVPGDDRVFVCEPGREMVAALDSLGNLILHEVVMDLRGIQSGTDMDCDMCQGTFLSDVLNPISGDWWLCDKCLREYMA